MKLLTAEKQQLTHPDGSETILSLVTLKLTVEEKKL